MIIVSISVGFLCLAVRQLVLLKTKCHGRDSTFKSLGFHLGRMRPNYRSLVDLLLLTVSVRKRAGFPDPPLQKSFGFRSELAKSETSNVLQFRTFHTQEQPGSHLVMWNLKTRLQRFFGSTS